MGSARERFFTRVRRGKPDAPIVAIGKSKKAGTKIRFGPDGEIFSVLEFSYDTPRVATAVAGATHR